LICKASQIVDRGEGPVSSFGVSIRGADGFLAYCSLQDPDELSDAWIALSSGSISVPMEENILDPSRIKI
jgi:hypothetical protein